MCYKIEDQKNSTEIVQCRSAFAKIIKERWKFAFKFFIFKFCHSFSKVDFFWKCLWKPKIIFKMWTRISASFCYNFGLITFTVCDRERSSVNFNLLHMFTIKIGLDESSSSKFNFSIFEIHKQRKWFFFTFSQFFTNKAITFYAEYDDMQILLFRKCFGVPTTYPMKVWNLAKKRKNQNRASNITISKNFSIL